MMIKMISMYSGNLMYVAEERLVEYLEAGHRTASAEPKKPEEPAEPAKPKKRATKK